MRDTLFKVKCFGRDHRQKIVLDEPVSIEISVRAGDADLSINVKCPHNTGGHGQRCKAAHPDTDKIDGKEASCCFSVDLPWSMDFPHDTESDNNLETHRRLHRIELLERLRKDTSDREWSQEELRLWVGQMGIEPEPDEILPQGVKYIDLPPPPITEIDIYRAKALCAELGLNGNKEKSSTVRR